MATLVAALQAYMVVTGSAIRAHVLPVQSQN